MGGQTGVGERISPISGIIQTCVSVIATLLFEARLKTLVRRVAGNLSEIRETLLAVDHLHAVLLTQLGGFIKRFFHTAIVYSFACLYQHLLGGNRRDRKDCDGSRSGKNKNNAHCDLLMVDPTKIRQRHRALLRPVYDVRVTPAYTRRKKGVGRQARYQRVQTIRVVLKLFVERNKWPTNIADRRSEIGNAHGRDDHGTRLGICDREHIRTLTVQGT
jgi:hypothetical protein